ncbi:MAG TPA: GNAT family N-acetyltransferase [Candidatus Tectomicrobia bacterium]|jgi:N-acetylglutamate synthase-like GNAT family acetyltransferase
MPLTSPVPRALLAASQRRTPHITIKRAETPVEFDGVFQLNYHTYVVELGQDVSAVTGYLVDPRCDTSVYLVAKEAEQVVGMAAITPPGHPFSLETSLADPRLVAILRHQACEFRRLAVLPAYRHTGLYIRLAEALAQHCIQHHIPYVFIAALESNVGLYTKLGFVPFDRPFVKGCVRYQPMICVAPNVDATVIQPWVRRG